MLDTRLQREVVALLTLVAISLERRRLLRFLDHVAADDIADELRWLDATRSTESAS